MDLDLIFNKDVRKYMDMSPEQIANLDRNQLRPLLYWISQVRLAAQELADEMSDKLQTIDDFIVQITQAEEALAAQVDLGLKSRLSRARVRKNIRSAVDKEPEEKGEK